MIEGVMRHGTSMNVEGNYVDSHGQSEIGFAITSLLGFKLLPRIKQINRVKLYGPDPDSKERYPLLLPAMTRPIRWELIEQNYDMLVKYATAIMVAPRRPKRSCGASPATRRTPSTKRCSSSAACRRRSSSRATYATATCNARSKRA